MKQQLSFLTLMPDSGWQVLGEVSQKILRSRGVDVDIVYAPREERIAMVDRGEADLSVVNEDELRWAYYELGLEKGKPLKNVRCIATIHEPNWTAFAVTRETTITSIEQIKERQYPLRFFGPYDTGFGRMNVDGYILDTVLDAYGFSRADIETWGGKIWHINNGGGQAIREGDIDAICYRAYAGAGPVGRRWEQATQFNNLRFLPIRQDILDRVSNELQVRQGIMPRRMFRGLDTDVMTFNTPYRQIFTSTDMEDELAFFIAKSYDEESEQFFKTYLAMSYSPTMACRHSPVPLHPGAEKYYRSKGYLG